MISWESILYGPFPWALAKPCAGRHAVGPSTKEGSPVSRKPMLSCLPGQRTDLLKPLDLRVLWFLGLFWSSAVPSEQFTQLAVDGDVHQAPPQSQWRGRGGGVAHPAVPAEAQLCESCFKFLWLVITQQFPSWAPCLPIILPRYKPGRTALSPLPPPYSPFLCSSLWLMAAPANNWEGEGTCIMERQID